MTFTAFSSLLRRASVACVLCMLPITGIHALSFDVSIDTTPLQGTDGYVAFDFIDGDGLINNSITIAGFDSDATLGGFTIAGDVTGSLVPGPSVIGDTDFFNELLQSLTFGTFLSFRLDATVSGPFIPFADSFSLFLLDTAFIPYPTSDPLGSDALLVLDIDGLGARPTAFTSASRLSSYLLPSSRIYFLKFFA